MTQINLMALRHSAFYSPFLMTMAGGHLKQAGLDATYTVQTPDNQVNDRLLDGSCHVSQSAVAASFSSLEENRANTIRHFAQINSRDGFFIASRKPVESFNWSLLKNKVVLVDHFFQPMAMFKYALHKKNIDWNELKVVDAGNVDEIDNAFRNGQGDFVHQQGPAPQQMQADGIATVVASVGEVIGPVAFSSLCATQEWLQTEMAQVFFKAYQAALKQCQQEDAIDISRQLHSYGFLKDIELNVLKMTINTYKELSCWDHDGQIGKAEYESLLDVFSHNKLISRRYPYEALIQRACAII